MYSLKEATSNSSPIPRILRLGYSYDQCSNRSDSRKSEARRKRGRRRAGRGPRFELSLANGFMDFPAASRGKSPLPFVSFLFTFAPGSSPISFHSCTRPPVTRTGLPHEDLPMQPRCGRSCHCSGDRYPSSRLRAKVTTLYLESQLMPPSLSRDHPLIIDEPPSALVLTQLLRNLSPAPAVCHPSERALEEKARISGKPKSTIPITRTIY